MSALQPVPDVSPCPHCGTEVEGPQGTYCCSGCEIAARILSEAGLESYYARREATAPRPRPEDRIDWNAVERADHDDGTCSVRLAVDGLRCASCVWVTERLLEQEAGVTEVRVSYATGRAEVRFDPEVTDLDEVTSRIRRVGYRPRPVTAEGTGDRDLLVRMGLAAFASMNIMAMAAALYVGWIDGMEARYEQLFRWLNLLLATPVVFWSAAPFFTAAWSGLRARTLSMDLPISVAIAVLYGHALIATPLRADSYLDSLVMLVFLLLVGRVLEVRGRKRAGDAAALLVDNLPRIARRVRGETVEDVGVDELVLGDLVDVGLGEEVPVDGVVTRGVGEVRMAMLTGESEPRSVQEGDEVIAGAVVAGGALRVRASRVGGETLVHRMAASLEGAMDAGLEDRTDAKIAPWFTGITLGIAAMTGLGWGLFAGPGVALEQAVAVLVVACPCALALARPLTVAAGLGAVARRGLLLRSPSALLGLSDIDTVALDKTGTVTGGTPRVVRADDGILRIAAGLERYSTHPVAQAVVAEAIDRGIPLPEAGAVWEVAGQGISGTVDGTRWTIRQDPRGIRIESANELGVIELADVPRDDASRALQRLRELKVDVALITGDRVAAAREIADGVGVDEVLAEVGPFDKAGWVEARQRAGHRVLFVGDGVNDGPAIRAADVGVAMGSGSASTVIAADGVVSTNEVGPLVAGLVTARITDHQVWWSRVRSVVYNVLAVGLAVGGWVNPLVAAILMPLSSLMVIQGALSVERRVGRALTR